jgi:uncharacterized protein YaiL (DUF2058 family)
MMKNALQEQLLKAGLAREEQLQSREKKSKVKRKPKPAHQASRPAPDLAAAYAARQRAEQAEKQEQERLAALKKANRQAVEKLIRDHLQNDETAEEKYQFLAGDNVKHLYVTPAQRQALINGELAITFLAGKRCLIPAEIAHRIQELQPDKLIVLHDEDRDQTEDEYADFSVPDDLIW